jgi:hypothetical protein
MESVYDNNKKYHLETVINKNGNPVFVVVENSDEYNIQLQNRIDQYLIDKTKQD